MPEVLQVGPFMIRLEWLLLAISGLAGYLTIQVVLKKNGYDAKPILDKIFNGILIVFFVWKFSPLISTPSILWRYPASLLTITGSGLGAGLGIFVAIWYIDRSLPKLGVDRIWFADLLALGMVSGMFMHSLLGWQYGSSTSLPWGISIENPDYKYHPVNVYVLIVTIPMLLWFFRNLSSLGSGKLTLYFLTYYSAGLMLVTLFKPKLFTIFGITTEQLIYLILMASGFVLSSMRNNRKHDQTI